MKSSAFFYKLTLAVMREMDSREQLYVRLPAQLAAALRALDDREAERLEEIRVYAGRRAEFVIGGITRETAACIGMDELLCALSAQALYSCESHIAEGYIPLPGGHRAGVCGRMTCQQDGSWRMTQVSSVCIRVARHIPQASLAIRPYLLDDMGQPQRVLLLGAPGCGKTTVLRDAALWLAQRGMRVAVADEREELFAGAMHGLPLCLDVLSGVDKARAFWMLLRSMAPHIMIADEIGRGEDVHAVLDAVRCGTGLLVSAHARSMEEAARRAAIRQMLHEQAFDWYILLGRYGSVSGVYDRLGNSK